MRVLQVIDTLEIGGAEKMAVNYANSLADYINQSHLCCTRREGELKSQLKENVGFICLEKRYVIDLNAFRKLTAYIKKNQIDIVHAHSSSYFLCVMLKIVGLIDFKLIWHDHYGQSEYLKKRPKFLIKNFSRYFDAIISVNDKLLKWSQKNLKVQKVFLIPNFLADWENDNNSLKLKGDVNKFKIICVANLRPQKDHLNLITAFEMLEGDRFSLHLVGKNFNDDYSRSIFQRIHRSVKKDSIFFYGTQRNIPVLLCQADVGVLSSSSEGLPISLLEYGMAGLPIVCTDVGECRKIVKEKWFLIPPKNPESLKNAVMKIFKNKEEAQKRAKNFQERIKSEFTASAIFPEIIKIYQNL